MAIRRPAAGGARRAGTLTSPRGTPLARTLTDTGDDDADFHRIDHHQGQTSLPKSMGAATGKPLTPEPTGVGVFEVEDGSGLWEVGWVFHR